MTVIESIVLSLAGTIIMILLGVIAFWLKRFISSSDDLTLSLNNLTVAMTEEKTKLKSFQETCKSNVAVTTKRLNAHAKRIDSHEVRITVIEKAK
ncbi:MAG: hypothetical protein KAH17_05755 [Bacteroidales bacterium]|nr:hypothetical protein [Bacteroidales bacterium]